MDLYHIWCDLKDGVSDRAFAEAVDAYLGDLQARGLIARYRLARRKLGLGLPELGEFHIVVETEGLAQLDEAFQAVSARDEPIEGRHFGVNSLVRNARFALYRDFPDPHRKRGEERF